MTLSSPGGDRLVRLHSLTALRFFAAAVVVVHHTVGPDDRALVDLGYLGVTFFFVLSGFVLTWSDAGQRGMVAFYKNRLARLYPLHLVLLLFAALASVGVPNSTATFVQHLTLTHSWSPSAAHSFNWVSWSISTEAFFYLLFPFWVAVLRRLGSATLLGVAVGAWLLQALIALGFALAGFAQFWTYNFPPFRLFEFVMGICLGLLARRGWKPSARQVAAMTFVAALGVLAVVVTSLTNPVPRGMNSAGVLPGVLALIWVVASRESEGRAKALTWRPLVRLGDWSFALYLVHAPLLSALAALAGREDPGWWPWWVVPPVLLVSVGMAGLLSECVERPAERRLRSKVGGRGHRVTDVGNEMLSPATRERRVGEDDTRYDVS